MAAISQTTLSNSFSWMKMLEFWLKFHWNLSIGSINIIPALVQIMAWRRPGDKPLSETMMVSSPTHICVTRPRWVNNTTLLLIYKRVSAVSYHIYRIYSIFINPYFPCVLFLFPVIGNGIIEFPQRGQYGQRLQLPIYYTLALPFTWIYWMQATWDIYYAE